MGLLDHVFDGLDFGGGGAPRFMRHNLRAAERLLAEGEQATARICGIRVRQGTDNAPDDHEFALELTDATSGFVRVGFRQRLGALTRDVRLGMEVPIRRDARGRAIVDAPAMGLGADATWGYKPLGDPPADGIADDNFDFARERRKSVEVAVTLLSATSRSVMGMPVENLDLELRVAPATGEPYEARVTRALVPFYALHLLQPGTELPGLVRTSRPDKVRIDWPAAAVADPGIGVRGVGRAATSGMLAV